ncbi:MAG: hypothetical protein JNM25_18735 [Planctomycetes bacterium]|nr:hypothetical protein [Planctomycetota bacterium]
MLRSTLAVLALFASLLPAQDAAPTPKKLRVHVIGASVSGGFRDGPMFGAEEQGDSVTMQQLLRKWAGESARVTTHSTVDMMAMFTDPARIGAEQIAGVRKARPDLVVAVDFAFWFAYGYVDGDRPEAEARTQRLQGGLDLLATLDMPVLLGDLPDMTGAARRMLNPRQIPSPEVLTQLNAQLAAFVAAHANLHLAPLAKAVQAMRTDGATLPLADGPLPTAPGALQQGDKLHANRLGMAYLGSLLQEPLRDLFPADHPLHVQAWTFEQFVEACGAEGDLELQREAAASRAR